MRCVRCSSPMSSLPHGYEHCYELFIVFTWSWKRDDKKAALIARLWVWLSDSFIFTAKKDWRGSNNKLRMVSLYWLRVESKYITSLSFGAVTIVYFSAPEHEVFSLSEASSRQEREIEIVGCETHFERQSSVVVLSWKLIHSIISFSSSGSTNCFKKQATRRIISFRKICFQETNSEWKQFMSCAIVRLFMSWQTNIWRWCVIELKSWIRRQSFRV